MSYVGADVESLQRAAAQLRASADELDGHNQMLTTMLGGIDWAGDVAVRFLSSWTGAHRANLTSTSHFFREAAATLERNAGEQQAASTSSGARGAFANGTVGGPGDRGIDLVGLAESFHNKVNDLDGAVSSVLLGAAFFRKGPMSPLFANAGDWAALRLLAARGKLGVLHLFGKSASPELVGRLGGLTRSVESSTGGGLLKPFSKDKGGTGLAAVSGGLSWYLAHREYGGSDAETYERGVDAFLGTAASRVPGGEIVYSASRFATEQVYGWVDDRLDIIDSGVESYAQEAYGTDSANLTPAQAAELNKRYSGLGGMWNSNYDVAKSNVKRLGGWIGL